MKKVFLFLVSLCAFAFIHAQTVFTHKYGIWNESSMHNFRQTSDGGYILCSDAVPEQDTATNIDFGYLVKMNAAGVTQWIKKYPKTDYFNKTSDGDAVIQAGDGGYVVASGIYRYTGPLVGAGMLYKTDNLGNLLWSKVYRGYGISVFYDVCLAPDSGFVACGGTSDSTGMILSNFILKTDASGNVQWQKTYTETANANGNCFYSVSPTSDSGYVLTGCCYSGSIVMKTDGQGTIQWSKTISQTFEQYDAKEVSGGGFIVTGADYSHNHADLVRLDNSGNLLWSKSYIDASGYFTACSVVEASSGFTMTGINQNNELLLFHADGMGNLQWARKTSLYALGISTLLHTTDNGYAFTSSAFNYQTLMGEVWVFKTDSTGTVCGSTSAVLTDSAGPAAITLPCSVSSCSPQDTVQLHYLPPQIVDTLECPAANTEGVEEFSVNGQLFLFPNPAGNSVQIRIEHIGGNLLQLRLTNSLGQIVFERKEEIHPGEWQTQLDLSGLSDGIYFLSVETDQGAMISGKFCKQ